MSGVNIVCLLGNVGAEPELRMTAGGGAVLKFSLATSFTWNDERKGKQEKTEWHRCVMFGKRAESLAKHIERGSKLFVRGRISYGSYEAKDGTKRYTTDIIIDDLTFAGSKGGQQGGPSPYGGSYAPADGDTSTSKPIDPLDAGDIPF